MMGWLSQNRSSNVQMWIEQGMCWPLNLQRLKNVTVRLPW